MILEIKWFIKLEQKVEKQLSNVFKNFLQSKTAPVETTTHIETTKIPSGYVPDSCVLRYFDEYEECIGHVLKMLPPMPYHVTSTIKREVQNKERLCNARYIKINFDDVKSRLEKILDQKISYNELSPKMANDAKILRSGLSKLHSGDDEILAFTVLTKSTLITRDYDLMECCEKIGCKYKNLDLLVQNSNLVCQMPYEFQKSRQKESRYRGVSLS